MIFDDFKVDFRWVLTMKFHKFKRWFLTDSEKTKRKKNSKTYLKNFFKTELKYNLELYFLNDIRKASSNLLNSKLKKQKQ